MQGKKRVSIFIGLIVISLIGISIVSASWFSDLFKIDGGEGLEGELPASAPASVNVTPSASPPRVIFVSSPYSPLSGSNVNLNLAPQSTEVNFTMLVTETPDGIANLPGNAGSPNVLAYALGNFSSPGEPLAGNRNLASCRWMNDVASPLSKNYSCSVIAYHYDVPTPIVWTINVQFADNFLRFSAVNNSRTFMYVANKYIGNLAPPYVNWTRNGLAIGSTNTPADNNITITNTGNVNIAFGTADELQINTTALISGPNSIGSSNFTGNENGLCTTSGFTQGSYFSLNFNLNRAPITSNFRDLTFCSRSVPNVPVGIYSTNASSPWDIKL